jgi:hypothetical protein
MKKEKYTKAKPVSLCNIEKIAGTNTMAEAINCDLIFVKFNSGEDKYLASAKQTNILHNSAGCT